MCFSVTLPALGATALEEGLPAHCSLPSADLRTQLPLSGNLPTASDRLLQSQSSRAWPASLRAIPLNAFSSILLSCSHLVSRHELFLTPISHLHSFFLSSEQQIPPVYTYPLTAQTINCSQPLRYLSHGPDAATNMAATPRPSPFTAVKHCLWCFQDTDMGY